MDNDNRNDIINEDIVAIFFSDSSRTAVKRHSQSNDKTLPTLPYEIWHRVLGFVTHLPGDLSIEPHDAFTTGSIYPLSANERAANLQDKRNLQLVCAVWHSIGVRMAYEKLILCCQRHAESLLRALQLSKHQDPERLGRGRWTKHIECVQSCTDHDRVSPSQVAAILEFTSNLQIFINKCGYNSRLGGRTHPSILKTLAISCGLSLLRLEWAAAEAPDWEDLHMLLSQTPNLRSLAVTHYHIFGGSPVTTLPPICLKKLRSMSLGFFPSPHGPTMSPWDLVLSSFLCGLQDRESCLDFRRDELRLPALESLSISPLIIPEHQSVAYEFMRQYGPYLKSLRLNDLCPRSENWYNFLIIPNPIELASSSSSTTPSPDPISLIFASPVQALHGTDSRFRRLQTDVAHLSLPEILSLCPTLENLTFNPLQPHLLPYACTSKGWRSRPICSHLHPRHHVCSSSMRLSHSTLQHISLTPPSELSVTHAPRRIYAAYIQTPLNTLFETLISSAPNCSYGEGDTHDGGLPMLKALRIRDLGAFGLVVNEGWVMEPWYGGGANVGEDSDGTNLGVPRIQSSSPLPSPSSPALPSPSSSSSSSTFPSPTYSPSSSPFSNASSFPTLPPLVPSFSTKYPNFPKSSRPIQAPAKWIDSWLKRFAQCGIKLENRAGLGYTYLSLESMEDLELGT